MKLDEQVLWRPAKSSNTEFEKFTQFVNKNLNCKFEKYNDVYEWSTEKTNEFWGQVWKYCGVKSSKTFKQVLPDNAKISDVPKWFEGAELNYAEHALQWDDDQVALYAATEGNLEVKSLTYRQLNKEVKHFAAALRAIGVSQGDRVVGYISNCMEAVIAMLATSSIGAIWSSTSPDFGVNGVLDRFSQISPKVIISVNAVRYNGKKYSHMDKLKQVIDGLPELEKVVVINFVEDIEQDLSSIRQGCWWSDFIQTGAGDGPLTFRQLPFSHPLYIMYSSGTTGAPKCIVHSQGGVLMKHFGEHILQGSTTRSDVMLYYTTTGWMMWNWLVGVLTVGGTCVLYDGSPLIPSTILWDLIDKLKVTIFGTGAKWLSVLEQKGFRPCETHSLETLHTILSTGSPLKPESYDYVYKCIKASVLLGSITGGTDIVGCFAGQNRDMPVIRGEIQSRVLGCAMEAWNVNGEPVYDESGEMVVTKPFPSMPVYFWNDEDGSKYKKAYFNKFEGVWAHGDFCMINSHTGGVIMLGRSDGTLNPNGVRFGSAEIYNIVEEFEEVSDSVCVAQRSSDFSEERVVLFLKLSEGLSLTEQLVSRLKLKIRTLLSARHVPALFLPIKDIPYTINGKKVEVAVRDTIAGKDVAHKAAFSNPESLDLYKDISELSGY